MSFFSHSILLFLTVLIIGSSASTSIDVENDDGSYTIGHQLRAQGSQNDVLLSYLTKSAGWTGNREDYENKPAKEEESSFGVTVTKGVHPFVEILKLVEGFIRLKGELAAKFFYLLKDNEALIKAVRNTVLAKIGKLHGFTLKGLVILRKIIEIAAALFGQWTFGVASFGGGEEAEAELAALFS